MLRKKKSLMNRAFAFDVDFYCWFPLWSDSNDDVVVVKFLSQNTYFQFNFGWRMGWTLKDVVRSLAFSQNIALKMCARNEEKCCQIGKIFFFLSRYGEPILRAPAKFNVKWLRYHVHIGLHIFSLCLLPFSFVLTLWTTLRQKFFARLLPISTSHSHSIHNLLTTCLHSLIVVRIELETAVCTVHRYVFDILMFALFRAHIVRQTMLSERWT